MGLFNGFPGMHYPYTDTHNLNLDEILSAVKKCMDAVEPPDLRPMQQQIEANRQKNWQQDVELSKLDQAMTAQELSLLRKIAESLLQANAYTDEQIARFPDLHTVYVVSPVSGMTVPVQTALDELYDAMRYYGLTAAEYDAKQLTATTYDGKQITAFDYDQIGARLLA